MRQKSSKVDARSSSKSSICQPSGDVEPKTDMSTWPFNVERIRHVPPSEVRVFLMSHFEWVPLNLDLDEVSYNDLHGKGCFGAVTQGRRILGRIIPLAPRVIEYPTIPKEIMGSGGRDQKDKEGQLQNSEETKVSEASPTITSPGDPPAGAPSPKESIAETTSEEKPAQETPDDHPPAILLDDSLKATPATATAVTLLETRSNDQAMGPAPGALPEEGSIEATVGPAVPETLEEVPPAATSPEAIVRETLPEAEVSTPLKISAAAAASVTAADGISHARKRTAATPSGRASRYSKRLKHSEIATEDSEESSSEQVLMTPKTKGSRTRPRKTPRRNNSRTDGVQGKNETAAAGKIDMSLLESLTEDQQLQLNEMLKMWNNPKNVEGNEDGH
ncbi:fibrous sheath CABYR-binding protein [Diachasma alloeum]|uniref:fibrous sheath CABYR-binding protein n=1 Tax=Diachasma alloeum TaxID=454923 RepID=UPI0007384117|nr:fibrous sheath CABYR-binding protein [Diachasma alloeum]